MIHQKSSNIKSFRGKKSDPWLSAFMKAFLWCTVSQVNWLNVQLVTSDWHWLKFNKRLLSGRKRTNVTGTAGLPRLRDSSSLMAEAWTCSKLGAQQNWMANGHWLYIDWKKLTWHLLIKLICGPISLSEQTREWKSTRKWFFLPKTNGPKTDQKDPEGSNKKKLQVTNFNGKTKTPACWPIPFSSNASNATTPGTPTLSVARAVWVAPGCRSFGRQTWCISQVYDNRVPQDISSMPIQILSIYIYCV